MLSVFSTTDTWSLEESLAGKLTVAKTIWCLDGDTYDFILAAPLPATSEHSGHFTVKIVGRALSLDAPEIHTKDVKEKLEGLAIREITRTLLQDQIVYLIVDAEKEKFGRKLVDIYIPIKFKQKPSDVVPPPTSTRFSLKTWLMKKLCCPHTLDDVVIEPRKVPPHCGVVPS